MPLSTTGSQKSPVRAARYCAAIALVILIGCGPSKKPADEKHFSERVVPVLAADIKAMLPRSGTVKWTSWLDRTEQDGLAPIPRTIGHSYIALGSLGKFDAQIEGKYEPKNPDLVFTTIKLTASGSWDEAAFPANALAELGFAPEFVALFEGKTAEGGSASVSEGERFITIQSVSSSFTTLGDGTRNGVVKRFEIDVLDAKKR